MNAREAVFWIYLIALIVGECSMFLVFQAIPQVIWQYISEGQKIELAGLIGFQILLGISGVLIALWVSGDGDEIRALQVRIRRLEDRVWEPKQQEEKKKT